jgi:hypothetical protein
MEVDEENVGADVGVETKEVKLPSKKHLSAEDVAQRYAFMPTEERLLLQSAPPQPMLMVKEACEIPAVYDMGAEFAGSVRADLRLRSAALDGTEEGTNYDITVPLKMLPYRTPADPKLCFDMATCRAVDAENERIEQHNKYITSLLSLFVRDNGCGTSANHITNPSPPDWLALTLSKRLQGVFKDKYAALCLAIRFLSDREMYCGKDYDADDAVKVANDKAFEEGRQKKLSKGNVRFRITGSPPATWSGKEEDRDSQGRRVKFAAGKHHSFISPEVLVVLAQDELLAV